MQKRKSVIRKMTSESVGEMFVVDLYENDRLVQTRELPGKSYYFAEDVASNWESGIIRLLNEVQS